MGREGGEGARVVMLVVVGVDMAVEVRTRGVVVV